MLVLLLVACDGGAVGSTVSSAPTSFPPAATVRVSAARVKFGEPIITTPFVPPENATSFA